MIPTIFLISVVVFLVIQLPPGDFVSRYASQMANSGEVVDREEMQRMREDYGLDRPWYIQYGKWMGGILLEGDFGYSLSQNQSVINIIKRRVPLTLIISLTTMVFTYVVAMVIGIYSAVRQYSIGDYFATVIGFLGMATPNFLLAIILMFLSFRYFNDPLLGLISHEYIGAQWTFSKFIDLLRHMVIPVIVIGTAGTAALIRVMRGQMLDQLNEQYMLTARSKGLKERVIILKYAVRAAINPIVSTIGWTLTAIFTGSTISAIVMNLPTMGPVMYKALLSQDFYLAGSWLFLMTILTVIGTLISDILLAWLDPRIRY